MSAIALPKLLRYFILLLSFSIMKIKWVYFKWRKCLWYSKAHPKCKGTFVSQLTLCRKNDKILGICSIRRIYYTVNYIWCLEVSTQNVIAWQVLFLAVLRGRILSVSSQCLMQIMWSINLTTIKLHPCIYSNMQHAVKHFHLIPVCWTGKPFIYFMKLTAT